MYCQIKKGIILLFSKEQKTYFCQAQRKGRQLYTKKLKLITLQDKPGTQLDFSFINFYSVVLITTSTSYNKVEKNIKNPMPYQMYPVHPIFLSDYWLPFFESFHIFISDNVLHRFQVLCLVVGHLQRIVFDHSQNLELQKVTDHCRGTQRSFGQTLHSIDDDFEAQRETDLTNIISQLMTFSF